MSCQKGVTLMLLNTEILTVILFGRMNTNNAHFSHPEFRLL
jgi:hypothetical protein